MKILWGDREQLHQEGVQRFLTALAQRPRYLEAVSDGALWRRCCAAASEVAQTGASIETVAYRLAEAWQQAQWQLEARCDGLSQQLAAAREDARQYKAWWENLRDTTSTANLHAWQNRAHALERELEQAQAQHAVLETRLAEQRHCTAAREATIVELNRVIARQVTEFDGLFNAMEE